jgi:cation diffusion facilitator family transporter
MKFEMKEKIAGLSVFVNFLLATGKIIVGILASSTAVFADGIHSGMDILSSAIGFTGIKIAKKPVDKNHPYGHYKFEVLAGLVITIILFITGLWILYKAYQGFINPSLIKISYLTLGVMLSSAVINEIMARLKIYYGKKESSVSLLSDGIHSRVDVFASIAIFLGLFLVKYWSYTDSLLALLIGLYIIKESFSLGKEATDSLLDVSAGEEIENKIKEIAKEQNIDLSELKTQKKGSVITANLKIKLPNKLSVEKATKISNNLKEKLINNIERLEYVAIQIESHDITSGYFKPIESATGLGLGRGFGWQRRGRMKGKIEGARGLGPEGFCICEKCGYRVKHERGIPCSTLKCPKCDSRLTRK